MPNWTVRLNRRKNALLKPRYRSGRCTQCNQRFNELSYKKRFCSERCGRDWKREERARNQVLPCVQCGRERNHHQKLQHGLYCSAECHYRSAVARYRRDLEQGLSPARPVKPAGMGEARTAVEMFG